MSATAKANSMTATQLVVEAREQCRSDRPTAITSHSQVGQALTILLDLVLASCDYTLKPNATPTVVARALAILIADIEEFEGPCKPPLSLHVNREVEASPVPSLERVQPLVEVADPPDGLTEIKIRDARGTRIGFFQVSAADLDTEVVDALKAWQARHTHELPTPKLVGKS
jgi:hypothetical protein